jgi:hypothetical protein
MGFATFMASWTGRLIRIIAGLALIVVGLWLVTGTVGIILAVVGAAPLIAGLFNFCLFAPLFGGPFMGSRLGAQH